MRAGALQQKSHKKKEKSKSSFTVESNDVLGHSGEGQINTQPINNNELETTQPITDGNAGDTSVMSDGSPDTDEQTTKSISGEDVDTATSITDSVGEVNISEPHMVDIHDGLPVNLV